MSHPVFTKSFFQASQSDQAAIVHAELDDLERAIGMMPDARDRRRTQRRISRIRNKWGKLCGEGFLERLHHLTEGDKESR